MKVIHKKLEMCNVEKNIFLRFAQKASEAGRGVNCNTFFALGLRIR